MKKIYAHFRVKHYDTGKLYHGGGVTVYGEWDKVSGELRAIGAACMPDDNYCYSRGRAIAEGRFKKYGQQMGCTGSAFDGRSINTPFMYTALTEAEVHENLASVAKGLAGRVHKKLPLAMHVRRYYRSTKRFDI